MIALMLVLIAGSTTWLAYLHAEQHSDDFALRMLVMMQMVLITLFGGAMLDVWGLATNAGTIWYADVMLCQWLVMRRSGWAAGLRSVMKTFVAIAVLMLVLIAIQDAPGAGVYRSTIDGAQRFAAASFCAFWLGQGVLIALYRRWADRSACWSYGAAMTVAQLVDSAVFFPVAFGAEPNWVGIAAVGFVLKVAVGLCAVPVLRQVRPVEVLA